MEANVEANDRQAARDWRTELEEAGIPDPEQTITITNAIAFTVTLPDGTALLAFQLPSHSQRYVFKLDREGRGQIGKALFAPSVELP